MSGAAMVDAGRYGVWRGCRRETAAFEAMVGLPKGLMDETFSLLRGMDVADRWDFGAPVIGKVNDEMAMFLWDRLQGRVRWTPPQE